MAALLRDNVYQAIRKAILACEYLPGQDLREQILAEKYRVSRSPIRDALLRLEQERLITVLPRQGYRVNPISLQDVQDLFGWQAIIEPQCAAKAADANDEAVGALQGFLGFTNSGHVDGAFIEFNRSLHNTFATIAGNTRLAEAARAVGEEADRVIRADANIVLGLDLRRLTAEHEAIIGAIQVHDSGAAHRLCRDHIVDTQGRILEILRAKNGIS